MSKLLRLLVVINSVSSAVMCYAGPARKMAVFPHVDSNYFAVQMIVFQLSTVIFGMLWKRKEKLMVKFIAFNAISEILLYVIAATVAIQGYVFGYCMIDMLTTALITKSLTFSWFYVIDNNWHDERKHFDIQSSISCSIGTVVGATLAMIVPPTGCLIWIVLPIGIGMDNLLLIYILYTAVKPPKIA